MQQPTPVRTEDAIVGKDLDPRPSVVPDSTTCGIVDDHRDVVVLTCGVVIVTKVYTDAVTVAVGHVHAVYAMDTLELREGVGFAL
ncbi:hypothetical protein C8259_18990 [Nocardia nova]|uniref:Uncharacterized protein n=1 Tax=Nocardia nova TaxID=37330 RepID=A0A2T2Z1P6_9NOCA|nr:hypothetical protein C8259_18990 [Nocardia nova]